MKELQELINLISKNKIQQIEIIGTKQFNHNNNYTKLYDGIKNGSILTEEEVGEFFFKDSKYKNSYTTRLIRSLRERLLNTLFFIDVSRPNYNEFQRAYYTCYRNTAAFKILVGRGAIRAAIVLGERTLKKAMHFEFTDIILNLAKDLRIIYGASVKDKKKYIHYNELIKKNAILYLHELKAEEYYSQITINFVGAPNAKGELYDLSVEYAKELRNILIDYQSYRLNLIAYNVIIHPVRVRYDYQEMLIVCKEAINFFSTKNHITPASALFSFSYKMLPCHIMLGNYDDGFTIAEKCLELSTEGAGNWHLTQQYYLILALHAGNYQKAYEVYKLSLNHSSYNKQIKKIAEFWKVCEAFVYYLIGNGVIQTETQDEVKKFRVNKFLNEVPLYSKDKRGMNITILILQILFMLQREQYLKIWDRVEALRTYTQRYLKKDSTYRSSCFIRMLITLPEANFHKQAVLRKSDKYWKRLQEVSLAESGQSAELEVIPYEKLWEFILDSLDNSFH